MCQKEAQKLLTDFFHRKQPIEQLVSKINESVSTFVINTDFPTINKRLTNMLISLSISFI
ncbi:hypothetical protein LACR_0846 [Lactococcus cremoris subsp. cremoris SK11]|uniref:Uncharacterized protein n=2 Tax=Lactococcus cremoris subsp. cremoris TaxID=2816960 RepID=T0WM99_LACLC|nr:hypothetical protein [Lactococcus cremoris]ABJ72398.1 hypothetical protein LACR_0846 [Lactococcus cremoris subsp. cremoris SK11]AEU40942.1 hypothetical protein llh_8830 [Lactococcus cremoris subsp. cremoris A76]EQC94334.1 hypothetical protein LLT3_07440 [Lactococcus cremoris subsp. cremoris TIFN3]KZK46623.1 hypothetical protein SK110_1572 [Lactococcus cremoris]KZK54347.1 hypothetical protein AM2_0962 [Lactococcus cremoris]